MTDESPVPHGSQGGIFPDISKALALNAWLKQHSGNLASAVREARQAFLLYQQRHVDPVMNALAELEQILMQ